MTGATVKNREKETLRKKLMASVTRLTDGEKREGAALVIRKLRERPAFNAVMAAKGVVAVYLPTKNEPDLRPVYQEACARGVPLCAPRWNGQAYELALLDKTLGTLSEGPHGILEPTAEAEKVEPSQPDVWLIPGVGFTQEGQRLGHGKGHYDRLLAKANPQAVKIGIAFRQQLVNDLPTEPHDRPMTEVLTP